jgi:ubiquinol-cytochrome c reductase iron-sulfur subunit
MTVLRAIGAWLVLRLLGRRRKRRRERELERRIVAPYPPAPRWEAVVIALLGVGALAAVGFIVLYAIEASTQALGLSLGGALLCIGVACVTLAKRILPDEELAEDYPGANPEQAGEVAQVVRESGSGLTRKGMLVAAAGTAGCAVAAAAVVPAASMGPFLDTRPLRRTPWIAGRRLVDEHRRPIKADDIEEGTFYTAFPEGARLSTIGAPLVLVRLLPSTLELPPGRRDWAPEGILAYSKICTHAGCAIALYRYPLNDPTAPGPALVCPCHYSTFDPARGAAVTFGPAGRPLPQLPLEIGADRVLRAAGPFSEHVGPAWSGVRERGRRA